jgi:glutamine cyclotransferase
MKANKQKRMAHAPYDGAPGQGRPFVASVVDSWYPGGAMRLALLALVAAVAFPRALGAATVRPEVVRTLPHDPTAFTQGLVFHQGRLLESTGLRGRSTLRLVVPETGVVERRVEVASDRFAEGLALVGSELIQLTWQEHVALRYGLDFESRGTFEYEGEGWGLCYDGARLVMSDGSSKLTFRDPKTFAVTGELNVTIDGAPLRNLNELECVGSLVYANVWQTDTIARIDAGSGRVITRIDASGLLTPSEAARADVLNGIAFDAKSGHFFLTGKLWPKLFEVRFPFDPGSPDVPDASVPAPSNTPVADAGPASARAVVAQQSSESRERAASSPATIPPSSSCGCRMESVASAPSVWCAPLALGVLCHARRRRSSLVKKHRSA